MTETFPIGAVVYHNGQKLTITTESYVLYGKVWQDGMTADGTVLSVLTLGQRERDVTRAQDEWKAQQETFARLRMAQGDY